LKHVMSTIDLIVQALAERPEAHVHSSAFYKLCKASARSVIEAMFSSAERIPRDFGRFGALSMPYTKMGAVDSLDLFGLDELIIFAFYDANRERYRRALDIGANLGLHSIMMSRCGSSVKAFEPDPWHYGLLQDNLAANGAITVDASKAAVSTSDGEAQFVRVLGNTTGSHLAGSKNSYGEKEHFTVPTRAARPLFEWADLAKIDAEGHEKELLLRADAAVMEKLDIVVEIGHAENARAVFDHFSSNGTALKMCRMYRLRIARAVFSSVPSPQCRGDSTHLSQRSSMVAALLTSVLLFVVALLVHVILWRRRRPQHQMLGLFWVFVVTPLFLALIWIAAGLPAIVRISDLPAIACFYIGAGACYMIAYTAVEETSPSLAIVEALRTAGSAGCSFDELHEVIIRSRIVERRMEALRRDRIIIAANGGFVLTARGRSAARSASLIARVFNIQNNA
jgi:FkbM family methyltransferase